MLYPGFGLDCFILISNLKSDLFLTSCFKLDDLRMKRQVLNEKFLWNKEIPQGTTIFFSAVLLKVTLYFSLYSSMS